MLNAIMILAAAFGAFWTLRKPKGYPAIITSVMILGILIALWKTQLGIYVYLVAVALAMIYALIGRVGSIGAHAVVLLMSLSIFGYWLWVNMHWHGNAVVAPIVTLMVAAIALFKKVDVKNELGFLVILTLDAVAILIENYLKAFG